MRDPAPPIEIPGDQPSEGQPVVPLPMPDRIRVAAQVLRGRQPPTPDLLQLFQDQERFLRQRFPQGQPSTDGSGEFDAELELRRRRLGHLVRSEALERYLSIGGRLGGALLIAGYLVNRLIGL